MQATLAPETIEIPSEPTDTLLRSLLDSELVLIGGGESVGYYNG